MGKKITKTAGVAALIMASVMGLAACGGTGGDSGSTTASTSDSGSSAATTAATTAAGTTTASSGSSSSGGKEVIFGNAGGYFGSTDQNPAEGWNGWYLSFYGAGETLFKLDQNYNANPWLAESYNIVDDNTWEFTIRDGIKFHDGTALTAEEVKKSLDYMMDYTPRGAETFDFKEIKAEGNKLTITTNNPQPMLIADLCDPLSVIQKIDDGIDYANASIMTGPFIVKEFKQDELVKLEAFADYWGGAPKIDSAQLISYADQDAAAMALQTGEIDVLVMPQPTSLPLFADTSTYTTSMAVSTRGESLTANMKSEGSISDLNVRKALAMCIDRQGYVDMANGAYDIEWAMFPDIMSYGGSSKLNLSVTSTDVEGAKKLLEDAGYSDSDGDGYLDKDGKNITINFAKGSNDPAVTAFAQAVQSQAKLAGIDVQINEYSDTTDVISSGNFDIIHVSVGYAPTGNPQYYFNTYIKTDASNNKGKYSNANVDALIDKLQTTFDTAERDKITLDIEQEIMNDMNIITYAHRKFYCVYKNAVTGYTPQPSEYYLLDNMIDISE